MVSEVRQCTEYGKPKTLDLKPCGKDPRTFLMLYANLIGMYIGSHVHYMFLATVKWINPQSL